MLYLWAREYPVLDAAEEAEISLRGNRYISAAARSLYSQSATDSNKMLGRALDPRANGTWLSKLTE